MGKTNLPVDATIDLLVFLFTYYLTHWVKSATIIKVKKADVIHAASEYKRYVSPVAVPISPISCKIRINVKVGYRVLVF